MLYCDTSFLAPLILEEATSAKVEAFIHKYAADELCVSHWTRVEFSSILAGEVRMGGLSVDDALDADREFDELTAGSFRVLSPQPADFELARHFIQDYRTALRAGDALHLAIARNYGAKAVLTLDAGMLKAGKLLKIAMNPGFHL